MQTHDLYTWLNHIQISHTILLLFISTERKVAWIVHRLCIWYMQTYQTRNINVVKFPYLGSAFSFAIILYITDFCGQT